MILKVVNIHGASEKFAELILLLESNDDVGTLKEKLEDEYLEIPTDSLKRVFAGQYPALQFSNLLGPTYWFNIL